MEFELLKLIHEYSRNGQMGSKQFYSDLFNIIVVNKNLHNYATSIDFTTSLEKSEKSLIMAQYNPFDKNVFIDTDSVAQVINNLSRFDNLFDSSEEVFMFKNFSLAHAVLHELDHAAQFKMLDDKFNKSLECKLVRACFFLFLAANDPRFYEQLAMNNVSPEALISFIKRSNDIYIENYKFNPAERLAEVHSFQTIISTLEPIKASFPSLYEYMNATLYQRYLNGYQDSWNIGISPTQVYLYAIGKRNVWQSLDFFDPDTTKLKENVFAKYDFKQRLTFGLPITLDEYNKGNEYMRSLNKFNV